MEKYRKRLNSYFCSHPQNRTLESWVFAIWWSPQNVADTSFDVIMAASMFLRCVRFHRMQYWKFCCLERQFKTEWKWLNSHKSSSHLCPLPSASQEPETLQDFDEHKQAIRYDAQLTHVILVSAKSATSLIKSSLQLHFQCLFFLSRGFIS